MNKFMEKFLNELKKLSTTSSDNYYTILGEWSDIQMVDECPSCHDKVTCNKSKCLCGHNLKYRHYIKNIYNNNTTYVGCCCINKFNKKIENDGFKKYEWMINIMEDSKKLKKLKTKFKRCIDCKELNVDKTKERHLRCLKCFIQLKQPKTPSVCLINDDDEY